MANQEEEKQRSPAQTAADTAQDLVRVGTKMKGKGTAARVGAQLAARAAAALAPAVAAALPILLIIIGVVVVALIIVIFIVIILLVIGVIGGGGGSAFASGGGLGVKDEYCQRFNSEDDLNNDGVNNDCSLVLKEILNEAAVAAKMPVGVLNGIGLSENLGGVMIMSEEDISLYSDPGREMPNCAVSGAGAKGPMQFTDGSVTGTFDTWSAHKDFIIDVGFRPVGYEPKICNIKDSIFAAAHKLKSDSGIPFDQAARPWTQEEVFSAARAYLGACESSGVPYCNNVWEFYQNKQDLGVGTGLGGPACYQLDDSWSTAEAADYQETFGIITQLPGFVEKLCAGGPVLVSNNIPADCAPYSCVKGATIYIKEYPNNDLRLFALAHESTHVIRGANFGSGDDWLNGFISSGVYEADGGLVKSYPLAALGGLDCSVDLDIDLRCYNESVAEAVGLYVTGDAWPSGSGSGDNVNNFQSEYPSHYSWIVENIFQQ